MKIKTFSLLLILLCLILPVFAEETQLQKEQKEIRVHTETIVDALVPLLKKYDQSVYDQFTIHLYERIDAIEKYRVKYMLKDIFFGLQRKGLYSMVSMERYTNDDFGFSILTPTKITGWSEDLTQYQTLVTELSVPGFEEKAVHIWVHGYEPERVYTAEEDWFSSTTIFKVVDQEKDMNEFMQLICGDEYTIASYEEWTIEHSFAWIENRYLSWIAVHHWSVHAVDFEYILQDEEWEIVSETTIPYFQWWSVFFK